jgi:hypothetical protein
MQRSWVVEPAAPERDRAGERERAFRGDRRSRHGIRKCVSERLDRDSRVIDVRGALRVGADERLPNQEAALLRRERRPLDVKMLGGTVGLDRGQHPRRLNETRGEGTAAGAGGPRPIAFAAPSGTECDVGIRHGHEQRAGDATLLSGHASGP